MAKYVQSKELERVWGEWMTNKDPEQWGEMSSMIYRICQGVATRFNPRSDEEHDEHAHDATAGIMEKINSGKLRFTPGKAPVFNLITTTAFHLLYSKMNKEKRLKQQAEKYRQRMNTHAIDVKTCEQSLKSLPVVVSAARTRARARPHFTTVTLPVKIAGEIKYIKT